MSCEETCDWAKPGTFLQMVNAYKLFADHMAFGVLEESTLDEVSVRKPGNAVLEPESKNLEVDDHTHTHFFLTHQMEPYTQGISRDLTGEENLMMSRGSYSQELIFHLFLRLCG